MVSFSRIEDLPAEATDDRRTCRSAGIKSQIALPLLVGGTLVGGFVCGTVREERAWGPEPIQGLQLLGGVFANALAQKQVEHELNHHLVIETMEDENVIAVTVRDSRPGIPEKDAKHIFDPLFTTTGEGLGMGLAIARTLVEAHGGRLTGSNHVDGGATFRFTLPVETANPA